VCPTYPETVIRGNVITPFLLVYIFIALTWPVNCDRVHVPSWLSVYAFHYELGELMYFVCMCIYETAWRILRSDYGTAVNAILAGSTSCEDDPCSPTVGFGGSPDEHGETALDAMLMDGSGVVYFHLQNKLMFGSLHTLVFFFCIRRIHFDLHCAELLTCLLWLPVYKSGLVSYKK